MSRTSPEAEFDLPLVSIIITNYNYAPYLSAAIRSAETQSYPHIECIVIDDASTDESNEVLDEIAAHWPDIKIIRKRTNAGQTAAFQTGFAASSGEYVVFLDADDVLFPTFVEIHVFTHLSIRIPVGLTSSDMLQTTGTRIVRSGMTCFSKYVASRKGVRKNIIRRIDKFVPSVWTINSMIGDDFALRIHLVDPSFGREWIYAPTSGNCFRRDALDMLLRGGNPIELMHNADTYLIKAVSVLNGAALIDIPLGIYRMHGENGFTNHPELAGVLSVDPVKERQAEYWAWRALVDRLVDNAALFVPKLGFVRYKNVILMMQKTCLTDSMLSNRQGLSGYIEVKLASRSQSLKALFGETKFNMIVDGVAKVSEPHFMLRPFAELFLSLGRILHARSLSTVGEWLWHL
jgi:glycosyltransferase involved in cell wall biosynthesis